MPVEQFHKISDLTKSLGICRAQVYKLIKQGEFPRPLKIGASSVWRDSDIAAWQSRLIEESQEGID